MQKRDIVICVILTLVTCGIYGLYWMVVITDDIGETAQNHSIQGVTAVILTIITCGIYGYYWAYKMGELQGKVKADRGLIASSTDLSILYLILEIIGLNIVNLCLMQNELNSLQE